MKCIPEDNNFNYTWEKRIGNLSLQTTGVNSSCLTIFNLRPEDSGDYRCIMSKSTGRCASDYTELSVYGTTCVVYCMQLCIHHNYMSGYIQL